MRTTGGYTLQQSLTLESASIVKQALSLARRRGHSQVTPLHVASAMLSSSTGLLRNACIESHSHPLQCKALELCFNVALNRLPTSASSNPLLIPHNPHLPSLSNALVAAFKRAQAHQRRGSIENNQQQQHVLALKVEIGQLVVSILDDPSVSRVMKEAGFSSLQVKANVEKFLTQPSKALEDTKPAEIITLKNLSVFGRSENRELQSDDISIVLESMMNETTKNTVIISESTAMGETLVKELIQKFDKNDVPDEMKFVQFISVPLFTLRKISEKEFEAKLGELRSLVNCYAANSGVVLYLGDLNWVSEFWSKYGEKNRDYFCPVEYMIMELSKLIHGEHKRQLRIMGIASFESYAKCKTGKPPLENLWSLHPLTVPVAGLSLSLGLDSGMHGKLTKDREDDHRDYDFKIKNDQLVCCSDCVVNFKREAEAQVNAKRDLIASTLCTVLPPWLQRYKEENTKSDDYDDQECDEIKYLRRKWNSICESVHKKPHFLEKAFDSSPSSSSSTSISSESRNKIPLGLLNCPLIFETDCKEGQKPELVSNPNSSPNSASSSEATDHNIEYYFSDKLKQFDSDNLNILCNALQKKAPHQADLVPDIVNTVLNCRSRTIRSNREDCWLFFLGSDSGSKETIARELAKEIFVSCEECFIWIGLSSFSSCSSNGNNYSTEEVSKIGNKKRSRNEHGQNPYDRFVEAIRSNPSRLFFIEDVDQFDCPALNGFKRAIEDGSVRVSEGEIAQMKDAIVVFSCEKFGNIIEPADSFDRSSSMLKKEEACEELGPLDLNVATEDDDDRAVSGNGILGLVDKQVVFDLQVLEM